MRPGYGVPGTGYGLALPYPVGRTLAAEGRPYPVGRTPYPASRATVHGMLHSLASLVGVVRGTVDRHRMIERGDRVLVAVSGGADSVGLALVLRELSAKLDFELLVAHVNHGLRGSAGDRDQQVAAAAAEGLGLPFVAVGVAVEPGGNLEARARELRYAALLELAAAHGCAAVATGHTRDDQAETFLMRLLRGAGARGLSAIHPARDDGVIRPLLDCDRAAVAAVVGDAGLETCVDEMNQDPRFLRTRIRAEVLPLLRQLNPEIAAILARDAEHARAAAAVVDDWVEERLAAIDDGLDIELLAALDAPARSVLLRAWIETETGQGQVGSKQVGLVERLAGRSAAGRLADLGGDWLVERSGERLHIRQTRPAVAFAPLPLPAEGRLELPGGWVVSSRPSEALDFADAGRWSFVCDRDKCSDLTVRRIRPGERIQPQGFDRSKKISRILAENRVARSLRPGYPVVACAGEVLWVPGLAASRRFALDPASKRALVLRAEKPS